jgi:hypothetical protein
VYVPACIAARGRHGCDVLFRCFWTYCLLTAATKCWEGFTEFLETLLNTRTLEGITTKRVQAAGCASRLHVAVLWCSVKLYSGDTAQL